jgi:hypothetical protein
MTCIWETISVPHFPLYTSKCTAVGLNKVSKINPTVSFEAICTNLKLTCYAMSTELIGSVRLVNKTNIPMK